MLLKKSRLKRKMLCISDPGCHTSKAAVIFPESVPDLRLFHAFLSEKSCFSPDKIFQKQKSAAMEPKTTAIINTI